MIKSSYLSIDKTVLTLLYKFYIKIKICAHIKILCNIY